MNLKFLNRFLKLAFILYPSGMYVCPLIASAACRIFWGYHLTYHQVLVLWFHPAVCWRVWRVWLLWSLGNNFRCLDGVLWWYHVFLWDFSYMRRTGWLRTIIPATHGGGDSLTSDFAVYASTRRFQRTQFFLLLEALRKIIRFSDGFYSGRRTEFYNRYYRWLFSKNYQVGHTDFRTYTESFVYEEAKQSFVQKWGME